MGCDLYCKRRSIRCRKNGWVITGPLDIGPDSSIIYTYNAYVIVSRIDARLEEQVRYQFNQEFCESVIDDVSELSVDDERFLEFVTNFRLL